jgi:MAF protein
MRLILASTSSYRRELLNRLRLPFEQIAPDFEEAPADSMPVEELIRFNTLGKARRVLAQNPDSLVIASDQLAVCGQLTLGKPGNVQAACEQLRLASGQCVEFLTGLTLTSADRQLFEIIPFRVFFRNLTDGEIETYVELEQPLDCAGSFKSEGLGISLFERMQGDDPTALIGLPLIRLSQWLRPLELSTRGCKP